MCIGMEVWSSDLWHWRYDLDSRILADAPMSKVLVPQWPICTCRIPMRGRCAWAWNFGPLTFDFGDMTLIYWFLYMLLRSGCLLWPWDSLWQKYWVLLTSLGSMMAMVTILSDSYTGAILVKMMRRLGFFLLVVLWCFWCWWIHLWWGTGALIDLG